MTKAIIAKQTAITTHDWSAFDQFINAVLSTVAPSSARIYKQTYDVWAEWCERSTSNPLDLRPVLVVAFLSDGNTTHATRQRQMSALRMLARMMAALKPSNDQYRAVYETLKMTRVPADDTAGNPREGRALLPEDVQKILNTWSGPSLQDMRNKAIVAVLFATGIRRAEAAALRWDDINFTDGTIAIRKGKGNKHRIVAVVGDFALEALQHWQRHMPPAYDCVFTAVYGESFGPDRTINPQSVYRAVTHTEKLTGVHFKPHDARRTVITDLLNGNALLSDVQAQAGHKQPSTTLRYSKPADAKRRRSRLKLHYGDKETK